MQINTRIKVKKTGLVGTLIELRDTPNGQSAKVKLDAKKSASWYWVKDLEVI